MEKLRFLAGTCAGGETPVEAGLRRSRSAASSMSVGVGGGEFATVEKESRERGEDGGGGENKGELVLGGDGEGASWIPGLLCKEWAWCRPPSRAWCWARPPNIFLNPASLRLQPG